MHFFLLTLVQQCSLHMMMILQNTTCEEIEHLYCCYCGLCHQVVSQLLATPWILYSIGSGQAHGISQAKILEWLQVSSHDILLICKGNAHYATGLLFYYCYYRLPANSFCQQSMEVTEDLTFSGVRKVQQQTSLI